MKDCWLITESREIKYRKCKSCQSSESGGTYPSAKPPTSTYELSSLSSNINYHSSYSGINYSNMQCLLLFNFNQREKLEITRIEYH